MDSLLNKTISRQDLEHPEVAEASRRINRLVRWMWWRRRPFAVNAALRTRWRIRWHKMWEYSRGLAFGDFQSHMRVLDFGGAATIPVFYLGRLGCELLSLDIDEKLSAYTNQVAQRLHWNVRSSTFDLTQDEPPSQWGTFDRIISYCVIEHIPKNLQRLVLARLAGLLKRGGIFELTFDYGGDAPMMDAIRSTEEVQELIAASHLTPMGNTEFVDTGERFRLDKRHRGHCFTFGSLFLRHQSAEAS
jgi:hypothetical protein